MIGKPRKYCAPRRIGYPLQLLDVVVDQYVRGSYSQRDYGLLNTDAPSILLMTSGHLGDALILSYAFPLIRQRYPKAQIDVLAGSWCDPIWKGNPYIRRVVHLNHVSTNRRSASKWSKWQEFYRTTKSAIKTLHDTVYDYSIDVRFSDSPMHFVLPYLQVRHKIGFGTRGFGGLLDEEFFMPDGEVHNFDLILKVLKPMGIEGDLRTVAPYFVHPAQSPAELWAKLNRSVSEQKPVLILPESGNEGRMLSIDYWSQLATRLLTESSHLIVFSGQETFTTELYERVRQEHPADIDRLVPAVGSLTLQDIASLSEQAQAAFTLDSLPMHLCCLGCPTFSFQKNGMGIQFFPIANLPTLVVHNHQLSRGLTIDRPGFQSEYVTVFDDAVQERAIKWFRNVNAQSQIAIAK
ncbi:lipopolysaccharide heptosyltransferase family protein [Spirosoma sp. HMF4905]|uniref:Lipopolysaccharide heptosyltransferase family protein n=1 Tax=Spirosoma arboris TaxID=2682092 RepID=A0A7K1SLM7_9BACT|nr:glycosyltransferase family 9 protein [Spirosoma arboris]MVM34710.1 lipopolysaccharide heptosyltransferase family protein [Spirosoma arboris]